MSENFPARSKKNFPSTLKSSALILVKVKDSVEFSRDSGSMSFLLAAARTVSRMRSWIRRRQFWSLWLDPQKTSMIDCDAESKDTLHSISIIFRDLPMNLLDCRSTHCANCSLVI